MTITFGMSLDGYEPPEPESSLGALVTGPRGMLVFLETLWPGALTSGWAH